MKKKKTANAGILEAGISNIFANIDWQGTIIPIIKMVVDSFLSFLSLIV